MSYLPRWVTLTGWILWVIRIYSALLTLLKRKKGNESQFHSHLPKYDQMRLWWLIIFNKARWTHCVVVEWFQVCAPDSLPTYQKVVKTAGTFQKELKHKTPSGHFCSHLHHFSYIWVWFLLCVLRLHQL